MSNQLRKGMRDIFLVFLIMLLFAGCSGSGFLGSSSDGKSGSYSMSVRWPGTPFKNQDGVGSRIIPLSSFTIFVSITGEGMIRPITSSINYPETQLTVMDIPPGNKVATIMSMNEEDQILSQRKVSFTIESGKTVSSGDVPLGVAITGTSTSPIFEPSYINIPEGEALQIQNWLGKNVTVIGVGSAIVLSPPTTDSGGRVIFDADSRPIEEDKIAMLEDDPATCSIYYNGPGSNENTSDYRFARFVGYPPAAIIRSAESVAVDEWGNIYVLSHYGHNVIKFNRDRVYITKWGSNGTGNGQFSSPGGVAVGPSGHIYVADTNNSRIQKFTSKGVFLTKWGTNGNGNGQFYMVTSVCTDAQGRVYATDMGPGGSPYNNRRVQVFDANGNFIRMIGQTELFEYPSDISFDDEGNLFITQCSILDSMSRVLKFTPDGIYLAKFGTTGSGNGQLKSACGMERDAQGNMFIAEISNDRVSVFNSNGEFLRTFGSSGSGLENMDAPYDVALDSYGNIYVADSGNKRVKKMDSDGKFLYEIGYSAGMYSPSDLAVDSNGRIYLVAKNNHGMRIYDSQGHLIRKFGYDGSGNGGFNLPCGAGLGPSGAIYVADTGRHRIQKFDSVGSFLSKWGSSGTDNGQFSSPYDVATDSAENVYVADYGNNRIQVFDKDGTFLRKWGSSGTGNGALTNPAGIFIDSSDNVYVADFGNERVQKFNSEGVFLMKLGGAGSGNGLFNNPKGVYVDGDGNIIVADSYNHRLQKFNSGGAFLTKWGSSGTNNGQFSNPCGVAVNGNGRIIVAEGNNNRIQVLLSDGSFLDKWGESSGNWTEVLSVTVSPSNEIYVCEHYYDWVYKFGSNGRFITRWGGTGSGNTQFNAPYSTTVGPDGNIYVADKNNNRIVKYDPNGNFLTKFGESGTGNLQFSAPRRVSFDSQGSMYICDAGNHRVIKTTPNFEFINKWGSSSRAGDGYFDVIKSVAVNKLTGTIYTLESSDVTSANHRIQKFDSNGRWIRKWGSYGTANGQMYNARHLAIDELGYIYVANKEQLNGYDNTNHRVIVFDWEGNFINKWGKADGTRGTGNGEFSGASGVAVDPYGNIYVSEYEGSRVQKFTSGGDFIDKWGDNETKGDGYFRGPAGIYVDSLAGVIYVTEGNSFTGGTSRVQKFDLIGRYIGEWGSRGSANGQFEFPRGITKANGYIYICDRNNNRIQVFTTDGQFVRKFGTSGSGNGQLSAPLDIVPAGGTLYVADYNNHRVQQFTYDGQWINSFGNEPLMYGPCGLAVDSAGYIYVLDDHSFYSRVNKFTQGGVLVTWWGGKGTGNSQLDSPARICIDQFDRVYITEYGTNIGVKKFTINGGFIARWGEGSTGDNAPPGTFSSPTGITVDMLGRIFVCDTNNSRVQIFIPQN